TLAAAGSSLQRAEGLASQDEAGLEAAVRERLQGLRVVLDADENDRRFATRFDEILLAQTQMTEGGWFNKATAFHALKEAFGVHGRVDFGKTSAEQVVRLLQQRPKPIQ